MSFLIFKKWCFKQLENSKVKKEQKKDGLLFSGEI